MDEPTQEPERSAKRLARRRAREQRLALGPVKRVWFGRTRRLLWQAVGMLRALLGRLNRFLGRIRPPEPGTGAEPTPTKPVRTTVLSATLCLGVAALLVSGKIVEIADRLPVGPGNDRWLEAATEVDRVSSGLGLDRPYNLLRDLRGAGDDAAQRIDVIGDVDDLRQMLTDDPDQDQSPDTTAATPPDPADPPDEAVAADPADATDTADADDPSDAVVPDEAADEADPADSAVPDDAADPTTPTATTAATTVPTTTTEPPEPEYVRPLPVSEQSPLRVCVAGDSQAFYLGHRLMASHLSDVLDIGLDQHHSTGLSRPDYFNWPVRFYAIADNNNPELVVATLGSNDWQDMRSDDGTRPRRGSDEWKAEWLRRVGVAFDILEATHRQVIWVGLPPARDEANREGFAIMNALAAEAAAERDFVTMIDIWDMFGGDGPYRESVPPPGDPDGRAVDVRQDDGVHLNHAGARWVIDLIEVEIDRIIAEINPATDPVAADAAEPDFDAEPAAEQWPVCKK